MALTDRNMLVRFHLKVLVYSWGQRIWVSLTSFQKNNIGWPQQPLIEKELRLKMDFRDSVKKHFFFKTSKLNYFYPQIDESNIKNDSEVLSSDFLGLRNLCSLNDLNSLCNLTGLNSPISSKNFMILMVWSSMASNDQYWQFFVKWIIKNPNFHWCMVPLSFGGCWGQPILLFWKLVDETQILWPHEYTSTFKRNLTCIFLSVRAILKETFQCETPCKT